jgi:hypothetical protein
MIGGMSWPPVEAEASTPAANLAGKPARFISGMVMTPVETVLATAEPEIVPVSAEPSTATKPGPPTSRPATARARSMTKAPAPERTRKAPNSTNMKTKVALIRAIEPNMPLSS